MDFIEVHSLPASSLLFQAIPIRHNGGIGSAALLGFPAVSIVNDGRVCSTTFFTDQRISLLIGGRASRYSIIIP